MVYKNGAQLGVVATGLTSELCWMVAMHYEGDSVRITGKPPPAVPYICRAVQCSVRASASLCRAEAVACCDAKHCYLGGLHSFKS